MCVCVCVCVCVWQCCWCPRLCLLLLLPAATCLLLGSSAVSHGGAAGRPPLLPACYSLGHSTLRRGPVLLPALLLLQVVLANPKTAGVARWIFVALWGSKMKAGDKAAREYVLKVFENVLVQPRDAREASDVFYKQKVCL